MKTNPCTPLIRRTLYQTLILALMLPSSIAWADNNQEYLGPEFCNDQTFKNENTTIVPSPLMGFSISVDPWVTDPDDVIDIGLIALDGWGTTPLAISTLDNNQDNLIDRFGVTNGATLTFDGGTTTIKTPRFEVSFKPDQRICGNTTTARGTLVLTNGNQFTVSKAENQTTPTVIYIGKSSSGTVNIQSGSQFKADENTLQLGGQNPNDSPSSGATFTIEGNKSSATVSEVHFVAGGVTNKADNPVLNIHDHGTLTAHNILADKDSHPTIDFNNGTLIIPHTDSPTTILTGFTENNGTIQLTGDNTLQIDAGNDITLDPAAIISGDGSLHKTGAGTLHVNTTNIAWTGNTAIDDGTVMVSNSDGTPITQGGTWTVGASIKEGQEQPGTLDLSNGYLNTTIAMNGGTLVLGTNTKPTITFTTNKETQSAGTIKTTSNYDPKLAPLAEIITAQTHAVLHTDNAVNTTSDVISKFDTWEMTQPKNTTAGLAQQHNAVPNNGTLTYTGQGNEDNTTKIPVTLGQNAKLVLLAKQASWGTSLSQIKPTTENDTTPSVQIGDDHEAVTQTADSLFAGTNIVTGGSTLTLAAGTNPQSDFNLKKNSTLITSTGETQFKALHLDPQTTLGIVTNSATDYTHLKTDTATIDQAKLYVDATQLTKANLGASHELENVIKATQSVTGTFSAVNTNSKLFKFKAVYPDSQTVNLQVSTVSVKDALQNPNACDFSPMLQTIDTARQDSNDLNNLLLPLTTDQQIHQMLLTTQPLLSGAVTSLLQDDLFRLTQVQQRYYNHQRNVWVSPLLERSRQKAYCARYGYTGQHSGLQVGLDGPWQDQWHIGAQMAYLHSHYTGKPNDHKVKTNLLQLGLYGQYTFSLQSVMQFQLGYAHAHIDGHRYLRFIPQQNLVAHSTFAANMMYAQLGYYYHFDQDSYQLTPFIRGQWQYTRQQAYTETGAAALNLQQNRISQLNTIAQIGVSADKPLTAEWHLNGMLALGYAQHPRTTANASLVATQTKFRIQSASRQRLHAQFNIQARYENSDGWFGHIQYQTLLSRGYTNYTAQLQLGRRF